MSAKQPETYLLPIDAAVVEALVAEHLAVHPYTDAVEANNGEFVFDGTEHEDDLGVMDLIGDPRRQAEVIHYAIGDATIPPTVFKKALAALVTQGKAFKYSWSNATTYVPCEPETDRDILRALVRFENRYHDHLDAVMPDSAPVQDRYHPDVAMSNPNVKDDAFYKCYEFCLDALSIIPHVGACHGAFIEMMEDLEAAVPVLVSLPAWRTLWRRVEPERVAGGAQ